MARTTRSTTRARTAARKTAARPAAKYPIRRRIDIAPSASIHYGVRAGRNVVVRLIDANRLLLLAGLGAAVRVTDIARQGGARALHELGRARNVMEKRAAVYVETRAQSLKERVDETAEQVDRRSVQATRALERRIVRVAGDVRRSTGRVYGDLIARGEALNARILATAQRVERAAR